MKITKINPALIFLTVMLAVSACTVNVNQPNANTNSTVNSAGNSVSTTPANKAHWSVVVCSSRAKSVTLSAGTSETDGEVFATWNETEKRKVFDFPAKLQNLSRVYFKGIGSDKNQVELCILYDGKSKKRVEFDDDEDVIISSTDTDDLNKCRCTE